jgi:thiol-disulfide isomerase/thioredoxin
MAPKKTAHRRKKVVGGFSRKNRVTLKKYSKPTITVGLIHASWCHHCLALKPEWKKMKKGLRNTNCQYLEIEDSDPHKDRKIAHVNSRLKGEKLVANGYPTIFYIKGGNLEYYNGERTSDSLQQWVKGGKSKQEEQKQQLEPGVVQRFFGGGDCGCGTNSIFGK